MKKFFYNTAQVAIYGLFLFVVLFAFFRCQESQGADIFRFRQNGTLHFVDNPKLVPKAATEVEKVCPRREFTRSERGAVIVVRPGAEVVESGSAATRYRVPADTTENGPFTCVRERRQVGAINLPVYVTRDGNGREVNETPSVWGCPQTSINR